MPSLRSLAEFLNRSRTGSSCKTAEWDYEVVPRTIAEIVKKYRLEKTFDPKSPVNKDMDLADEFYKAGVEAALRLGLLCTDTETVIKVSEEELLSYIDQAPSSLTLGTGVEQVTIKARTVADPCPPVFGGPLSIAMSEENYVPLVRGILKSRLVQIHEGPSLDTVFGYPLLAGTPFETIAAFHEQRMRLQAQWEAGRVGMGNMLVASSSTEYGGLAAFGAYQMPQIALCLTPAALKTNYATFHKAASALAFGLYIESGSPTMIGGYTGSPEGSAVAAIATDLLQYPIHQAHMSGAPVYDIRYAGNCGPHAIWSQSISTQAVARNTHVLMLKTINQVSGPCTEMFFYETIAGFVAASVSGLSFTIGPRAAGGKYKDFLTPVETWFAGAIFRGAAGLSIEKANEIINYAISKFENQLGSPPKGKSFTECWDVRLDRPSPEYLDLYVRMRKEAKDLGIPLPPDGVLSDN